MCHFWNFGQWPSFIAKYGNFENQPLSWKLLPIQRKYAQFLHPGIERECMCNFWNFGPWPGWLLSRASRPMGLLYLIRTQKEPARCPVSLERKPDIRSWCPMLMLIARQAGPCEGSLPSVLHKHH